MRAAAFAAAALFLAGCSASVPQSGDATSFDRATQDNLAHGERIATVLGCLDCHGADLAGRDHSDELGTLWTANLTRSAAMHSDEELRVMIVTGRRPDRDLWDMPSHLFGHLSAGDMASLIAFIRSKPTTGEVHPPPTFGPELRAMMTKGEWTSSRQQVEQQAKVTLPDLCKAHAQGRYIVQATCAECHGKDLRGGPPPFPGDPPRPDLTMMVPACEPVDFATLMRTGKAAGDRELVMMSAVARDRFAHFTPQEVEAVGSYIAALAQREP